MLNLRMKPGFYLLILLLTITLNCFGQATITGKVLNNADKKPVTNVNVFLSNSVVGDKTSQDGTFTLQNVKPGKYELVISIVGFQTLRKSIHVDGNLSLPDIQISARVKGLKEVVIKTKEDPYWDSNFERFKNLFLGTSDFAKRCKILNPKVLNLDIDRQADSLTASSYDFIEIENKALGYRIKYLLNTFTAVDNGFDRSLNYQGDVLFTAMKGTPVEERNWRKARLEAYENSEMHFLRAALHNRLKEEGFKVLQFAAIPNLERPSDSVIEAKINFFKAKPSHKRWKDSLNFYYEKRKSPKLFNKRLYDFPLKAEEIISQTEQPNVYVLGCDMDALHITYNKKGWLENVRIHNLDAANNHEVTMVNFKAPYVLFDNNGWILEPGNLSLDGVWARNRVAELLPVDYDPADNGSNDTNSKVADGPKDSLLVKLVSAADSIQEARPVEKVYLHLNKPYYYPGDTIWYKSYTVSGNEHKLSALSGILYVELTGPGDSLLKRETLKLDSGMAPGDFSLPIKLAPGVYHLRAYTNWMRNQDAAYFYNQSLQVVGFQSQIAANETGQRPDVQFFPEGGDLVNGIRSKVAVKAVNANGLGEDIKGTVTDNDGKDVATFTTQHLGMGAFALVPQEGKSYKANITASSGAQFTVDLPVAKPSGYTMALNNADKDSLYVKISVNDKFLSEHKNSMFYLIAQSGGKVYFTSAAHLSGPVLTTLIPKSRFPTGILQFTLLSATGEPLNERVAFIQQNDNLKLNISAAKQYTTRQNVKIDLQAKSATDEAVSGNFSVSVINENYVPVDENAESTILSNLLLTSDLKGYVEKPNYYFINENEQTRSDLDLLMLTQGYRKFEWEQVSSNHQAPLAYQPEELLELKGSLKTNKGKPIPNGKVRLLSAASNVLIDNTADANGNFKFTELNLTDTDRVVLSGGKQRNYENIVIHLDKRNYPAIDKISDSTKISPVNLTSAQAIELRNAYKTYFDIATNLKGVTIKGKRISTPRPLLTHSANMNGVGHADQIITGNQLQHCPQLVDCLAGKLLGVIFKKGIPYNIGHVPGRLQGSQIVMAIYVDGMPVRSDYLSTINVDNVYGVEVLRSAAYTTIYGTEASGGALLITTKRGGDDFTSVEAVPGLITYRFKGFYVAKTFYSPKYSTPQTTDIADTRNAVYWNPDITTNQDGKASFEYFNAGTKGTYRVVVEGIDSNGDMGRQVYRYKVE